MISLNRMKRMEQRIAPYINSTYHSAPKHIVELMKTYKSDFTSLKRSALVVQSSIGVLYILIYVSIVTSVLGSFFVTELLYGVAQLVGTTILFLLLAVLHWYLGVLRSDAHTVVSEIISLGSTYVSRD